MDEASWSLGRQVECDGLLAVDVGTDAESWVPEGHLALWFGRPQADRISEGGPGGLRPEAWTVPSEYCVPAAAPVVLH